MDLGQLERERPPEAAAVAGEEESLRPRTGSGLGSRRSRPRARWEAAAGLAPGLPASCETASGGRRSTTATTVEPDRAGAEPGAGFDLRRTGQAGRRPRSRPRVIRIDRTASALWTNASSQAAARISISDDRGRPPSGRHRAEPGRARDEVATEKASPAPVGSATARLGGHLVGPPVTITRPSRAEVRRTSRSPSAASASGSSEPTAAIASSSASFRIETCSSRAGSTRRRAAAGRPRPANEALAVEGEAAAACERGERVGREVRAPAGRRGPMDIGGGPRRSSRAWSTVHGRRRDHRSAARRPRSERRRSTWSRRRGR